MNNRFLTNTVYLEKILTDIRRSLKRKNHKPLDRIMCDVGYAHYLNTEEMNYIRDRI